ncbi:MAG: hypothetical protein ACI9FN_000123 [Saprospiraceae bacterium]|jgi:hypothetical protein
MKTLNTLIVLALLLVTQMAISQRTYDIRFVLDSLDSNANTVCYRTEIRSADGQAWNLAGQNYRIFYAGSMAEYIDDSATSLLPENQYFLDLSQVQDAQHVDASDFGFDLGFASDLSFLNYSIDLMSLNTGGINLEGNGEWVPTSKLCFDVPPEATTNPNLCLEFVWARMGRTDDYATAFVEVSQWVQTNFTTDAVTNIYDDLDSQDCEDACLAAECDPTIITENTLEKCTDGLDNDNDGLIDCQDDLCFPFCPEDNTLYDISLNLASVDCVSGTACYSVNLKSATENAFILGSQEYRVYYNSAVGTYLSGSSLLSDLYQPYALQDGAPIENRNASDLGDLPYEDDLGYLSFSIQLNDNSIGGDQVINDTTFEQVVEICFTMTADAINDELVCFEANFAQIGVTDPYDSDLLILEEWKAANDIIAAGPVKFSNIDASKGDEACFNISCPSIIIETGDLCGDGIDNDNDGLIDCADPGCSTFPACEDDCLADAPVLTANGNTSTQCDFVTGPVSIISTGGNNTAGYNTQYVLTNADGMIQQVQNTPNFEVGREGFYSVYAINYKSNTEIIGLEVGGAIATVTSLCFEISSAYTFTACQELDPCNYCLGERIEFDPQENDSPDFTYQYLLTNKQGDIIEILDDPVLDSLDAGLYLFFPINYEANQEITGLEVGQNISGIQGCCVEIQDANIVGVCDQLNPTIFFDLQGCDITQNAVLVVGGLYDSYEWNTGSNRDFITVSATEPAIYRVTVTLASGCIGIGSQEITGNEISRIGDYVWEDLSPNGRQDPTDLGLNGVTVNLHADFDRNGTPDIPNFASCTIVTGNHPTTGLPGYYEFTVYQSNYVIEFVSPSGYVPADQNKGDDAGDSDISASGFTPTIAIGKDQVINNIDAGFRTSSAICGSVWEDFDSDGRREAGDTGMNDITINLYTSAGLLLRSTVSADTLGSPGFYCFEDIPVQEYYVEIVFLDGGVLSPPNVGNNDALDSEGTNANGLNTTNLISTNSGQTTSGIDFGYYTGGSICGIVFQDIGGAPGVYDAGTDSIIVNSFIAIIDAEIKDTVSIAATDADGRYCATNIPVGSYQACFGVNTDRDSYVQQNSGDDPLLDSDVNTTSGKTEVIFVSSGETINGINAGIRMDALPIELLSFTGKHARFSKSNILDWSTAIEINNDRFEIERLLNLDGTFVVIGTVQGEGTTNKVSTYQYTDKDASMPGNYYYRLRQVDFAGGSEYSKIIALKVGSEKSMATENKLIVFPNPATERVQILVQSSDDNILAEFLLTDILGRVHKSWKNVSLNSGDNLIQLELNNIGAGNYILQHNNGATIRHQKLQVIK